MSYFSTLVRAPNSSSLATYYFRKTFNLSGSSCVSGLNLDIIVMDGSVLYLNNVEVLRLNIPQGYLDNKTNVREISVFLL